MDSLVGRHQPNKREPEGSDGGICREQMKNLSVVGRGQSSTCKPGEGKIQMGHARNYWRPKVIGMKKTDRIPHWKKVTP